MRHWSRFLRLWQKTKGMLIPLLAGIALMVFPYFVSNVYLLVIIGTDVTALPYFLRS